MADAHLNVAGEESVGPNSLNASTHPEKQHDLLTTTRLALLFLLVGAVATVLGTVVHELGHALFATFLGIKVTSIGLTWFNGGWAGLDFSGASESALLAIDMGGIVIKLLLGAALLLLALLPRKAIGKLILVGTAASFLLRNLAYLTLATHYGFGDGLRLHGVLEANTYLVVIPSALLLVVLAYFLARWLTRIAMAWIPSPSPIRTPVIVGTAALLALVAHLGLTLGERVVTTAPDKLAHMARMRLPPSTTPWRVSRGMGSALDNLKAKLKMRPGPERKAWARKFRRKLRQQQSKHRPFPLLWILICAVGLAGVTGVALPGS